MTATAPSVGIAILAAGASTRMGRPKQLLCVEGETLIRRAVRTALATGYPVMVIIGSGADAMKRELSGMPVSILENTEWREGIASSLRCAVRHLPEGVGAILVMTIDQPLVTVDLLTSIMEEYAATSAPLVACRYAGTLGIPALYSRALFPDLLALSGDAGAKRIIEKRHREAHLIDFPGGAVDIDTPEGWAGFAEG